MLKKITIGLVFISSASFAGEDLSSNTEEKFEKCVLRSDMIKEFLMQKCDIHQNLNCYDRVEKLWQRQFESCVINSDSEEIKQRYLVNKS